LPIKVGEQLGELVTNCFSHCIVCSSDTIKGVGKQLKQLVGDNASPTPVSEEMSEWTKDYLAILSLSTSSGPSCGCFVIDDPYLLCTTVQYCTVYYVLGIFK
jgi:hypothetical protein